MGLFGLGTLKQDKIVGNIGVILGQKNISKNVSSGVNSMFGENATTPKPKNKGFLTFDSNFESGNLFVVFRTGILAYSIEKYKYDLVLNNDINSKGSTQWFFFSVEGM